MAQQTVQLGFWECQKCGRRGQVPVPVAAWDHVEANRRFVNTHLDGCFSQAERERGIGPREFFVGTRTLTTH
jgi:hypothetical protein